MNKDIIYIDVEDDITAIIGKVKDAKEKIVALVPPKRVGVLQSAVNLRLLARAAGQSDKHLVLISNNAALMALAASASILVAKNLQSKPSMAEIPALEVDDGDDIIDGSQLPVGELLRTADKSTSATVAGDPAIDEAVRENAAESASRATPPLPGEALRKPRSKSGVSVPNFDKFRKKLVLIIGAGVLLVIFLIWAIFFAASANIIITARTTDASANAPVTLASDQVTDMSKGTVKTTMQQIKKDAAVSFDVTGTKDVGATAKGQIIFKNCETLTPQTIPAGTGISANGLNYVTQEVATVTGGAGGFGGCASPGQSSPVSIVAAAIGENYNTPNGTTFSVAGHPNSSTAVYFRAIASSDVAGGSKRQIKVVTDQDVQKASDQLAAQNSDEMKKQLSTQFGKDIIVIDQTFKSDKSNLQPVPAVGTESTDGKGKLTSSITYSMSGVDKSEAGHFLDAYFTKQLEGKNDQRVYDNGIGKTAFTNVNLSQSGAYTANLVATAKIGPKIDDTAIKNQAQGKKYGEIQSSIVSINGVDSVDVKFSPFWVSSAPHDIKRITVTFKLNG